MSNQYLVPGLYAGGGIVEANYVEDLFVETGQDTMDNVVLAAGNNLPAGTPIAIRTTDYKAVPWEKGGANGASVFHGMTVHPVDYQRTMIHQ